MRRFGRLKSLCTVSSRIVHVVFVQLLSKIVTLYEIKRSDMSLFLMFVSLRILVKLSEKRREGWEEGWGWGNQRVLLGFCSQNCNFQLSRNSTQKISLPFSPFSLLNLLVIWTEEGRGSSSFFKPKGVEIGFRYLCQATLVDLWIKETETQTYLEKNPWISK